MAKKPSVRQVNGYWYSEAGGVGRYFGRCDGTSHAEAMARLWATLAHAQAQSDGGIVVGVGVEASEASAPALAGGKERSRGRTPKRGPEHGRGTASTSFLPPHAPAHTPTLTPNPLSSNSPTLTVNALAERFLAWVLEHRGANAHRCRSCHLRRFRDAYGDVPASDIDGAHLEAFIASLRAQGFAADYQQKHKVSVGAMYNKAVKKGWLPPACKPMASVEPIRLDPKPLLESDLPTDAEVKALFQAADADPHGQMGDFVRLYHATGARTHELIEATVGDFQRNAHTIVLGKHKRSHTMKDPTPRTITLNAQAHAILARRCEGKKPSDTIFIRPKSGKAMARFDANQDVTDRSLSASSR